MTAEPRLAVVTFRSNTGWFARTAFVQMQGDLVAGTDCITGEWFQCWGHHCSVSFDPQEVTA